MPFTYKIDTDLGLIFYSGFNANGAEILQAEKAAANDPSRLPSMKIIVDLSNSALDISLNDIYEALKMNRNRMEKGSALEATAFISHSRFIKALGDTYRLLGENMPLLFGIFHTLPDAIKWLGLSDKGAEISRIQEEIMKDLEKKAAV